MSEVKGRNLSRCVTNRSSEVILRLNLALVRPHLDYAAQFWSPYYRKDIGSLEAVQRRMTKMIQGLRNLPYKDRLKRLNLEFRLSWEWPFRRLKDYGQLFNLSQK